MVLLSSHFLFKGDSLLSELFGFFLLDGFNEDFFIFELVTLGGQVELVIELGIDLSLFSVFFEESSEDTLPSDPEDLGGHSGVLATSSLTTTGVSAPSLFFESSSGSGSSSPAR